MSQKTFSNPILSGFYPDPSICRVGDDYYMVTSSFVYYPGLPIFHSKDLVNWEQIGHGIERTNQLDYKNCETSLGLWAPTIRFNEGKFYIINTFVSEGREARRDNFIITADNPAGPWSDPVFIEGADGIDPSIFFDDDGKVWYAGNCIIPKEESEYEGHHAIYLCELDPESFQIIRDIKLIWNGNRTTSKWIEAPHIYKKDGYYYLIVAEGGTFTNHSVMMARSKTIDGDYEICPRNPVVTHRHVSLMNPISVVGHADIVETQNGEWWMVLLGVRPYEGINYNLGRETFLAPIVWDEDGWIRLDTPYGLIQEEERRPNLEEHSYPKLDAKDDFDGELSMIWNTVKPYKKEFFSLTERESHLRIYLQPEVIHEICTPAFIGRRQQHKNFEAIVAMDFTPDTENEEAGIVLLSDDRFNYSMVVAKKADQSVLRLYQTENSKYELLEEISIENSSKILLGIKAFDTSYDFYYGDSESEMNLFKKGLKASLLSSTVNEGFTGSYIGMYASSNKQESKSFADFDWFKYEAK
ncbi:glycoside hydrolase family 43 protein [Plebeiibacterium sediminum]|uniref:Glycoside hydrolase family 43 protein n=1 Tax=Plebeiibacterium sediminum TaxID=2992112 RepID=A0AAE3M1I1_9BACT|nr:glycoside hydrolase family 43 protein [Plebeiobacterium sediminum]MCW3785576.1 glycoside hydrolase family 43 protein [Plebeiobacterium sediminum]